MHNQTDQQVQGHEHRRGAGDGQIAPLTLGLHAELATGLLKGHLQRPAPDEQLDDPFRGQVQRRGEEGLRRRASLGIDHQDPANRQRGDAGRVP